MDIIRTQEEMIEKQTEILTAAALRGDDEVTFLCKRIINNCRNIIKLVKVQIENESKQYCYE